MAKSASTDPSASVILRVSRSRFSYSQEASTFSLTAMVLVRLREDLPDHELEAGHDVSAGQNVGFGEGGDIGW